MAHCLAEGEIKQLNYREKQLKTVITTVSFTEESHGVSVNFLIKVSSSVPKGFYSFPEFYLPVGMKLNSAFNKD